MALFSLVSHPDLHGSAVESVRVQLSTAPVQKGAIRVEYEVRMRGKILLPPAGERKRADGLWRTTCFEMFIAHPDQPGYLEVNLSPSLEWAVYEFDSYRGDRRDLAVPFDPKIEISKPASSVFVAADIGLSDINLIGVCLGLSAVIEETDGTKSYWALAHAPGPPDFHNRDCFIATLPAPTMP